MTLETTQEYARSEVSGGSGPPEGFFAGVPALLFRLVGDGSGGVRFSWVGGAALDLVGVTAEALLGDAELFFARVRGCGSDCEPRSCGSGPGLVRVLANALDDGAPVACFLRLSTTEIPDGAPFRMTVRHVTPGDGRPALDGMIVAAESEDVIRAEVEKAELRFRKAFQASPGMFVISDPWTGRHIDINDHWLQVMGWRREEVIGRTAEDLNVWVDPRDRHRLVALLTERGAVRDFETRFRTRSGIERDFLVAGEQIELGGRQCMLLVAHDVTDRNTAQRALARLNADLERRVEDRTRLLREENRRREEIQRRLEAIMDGVADAIVSADGDGVITGFNAAAQAMFGWSAEEVVGLPLTVLMPEPYASRHDTYVAAFLDGGAGRVVGMGRELTARRRDGSPFPIEVALSHLRLEDEDVFIAAVRDITDRREVEEQLRAAKEAAELANAAKSAFLSSMSHELRTPLNAILGFAQLLEVVGAKSLEAPQRDYIRHILSAGQHLLTLINDVLDLSKIESGNVSLTLEPVDSADLLDGTLTLMRSMSGRQDVTLEVSEVPADLPRVWGDQTRLGQVLLNLASNAVKYNHAGGSVRLTARPSPRRDGMVELAVHDTGPGIPEHRRGDLFKPFNRLGAENGAVEGTGIGLSIAKQLVEVMGGTIGCRSEVGRGTTFWVDLPVADRFGVAARPVDA